ncbi:Os01g0180900 [Oryza sativa Japonica Group]|uniref:Os01g0180900 protein n=1 Tax=Oryza sativa subsp. japonica TaxID=39947 RepID=A0A0P0UZ05_ORYSJ|nr:Os01g0180900 [Oryza sativa Japonica Group]
MRYYVCAWPPSPSPPAAASPTYTPLLLLLRQLHSTTASASASRRSPPARARVSRLACQVCAARRAAPRPLARARLLMTNVTPPTTNPRFRVTPLASKTTPRRARALALLLALALSIDRIDSPLPNHPLLLSIPSPLPSPPHETLATTAPAQAKMPLPRRAATVRIRRGQIHRVTAMPPPPQQAPEPAGLQLLLQPEVVAPNHPPPAPPAPAAVPAPPQPQGEARYRRPLVRLQAVPNEDHVPDNYGDGPDELGITPAVYQALERHLPPDLAGAPAEVKRYFMRSVLRNYVPSPSQRIRVSVANFFFLIGYFQAITSGAVHK